MRIVARKRRRSGEARIVTGTSSVITPISPCWFLRNFSHIWKGIAGITITSGWNPFPKQRYHSFVVGKKERERGKREAEMKIGSTNNPLQFAVNYFAREREMKRVLRSGIEWIGQTETAESSSVTRLSRSLLFNKARLFSTLTSLHIEWTKWTLLESYERY